MEDRSNIEIENFLKKHEDIIYIAGLLDGEGCIGIWRSKKYFQPCVIVSNQSIRVLRRIKRIMGFGNIVRKRTANEYQIHNRENIRRLLTSVYPYLTVKKEEAQLMLEFLSVKDRGKQAEIAIRLSNLKTKNKRVIPPTPSPIKEENVK